MRITDGPFIDFAGVVDDISPEKGKVKVADSLDELAQFMRAKPEVLKKTVEEYNAYCDKGHDDVFAKDRAYLKALRTPPYYALGPVKSWVLVTPVGVAVNARLEVLDAGGAAISGLYAAGGVGAIYDLAGNDRYEGGEFSQAGGYYFGLGILHDKKGHDLYYGNRYGQSFSAHQAIGILVDEEKLQWDDKVAEHLPWFELYDPYVTREITIRDLLSHRSGLGRRGDVNWYATDLDREEVVRRIRFLEPNSSFRSQAGYQNTMFLTAGMVTEAVSGMSWDDWTKSRIWP